MSDWTPDDARAQRNASKRKSVDDVRDIGPPPEIVNPERREACKTDLALFLKTYFPLTFELEFSEDHKYLIECAEKVLTGGGQFVCAMPRGSGKTSIFQKAMIWAILYGHRKFPMLLAGDDARFKTLLQGIKTTFETGVLLDDFPEVVHPIMALEKSPLRANTQLCEGESTYLTWGASRIILPTTKWTIERGNAGCAIGGGGLGGSSIRGALLTLADGRQLRPDAVLADDPQTRRSAKSLSQCQEREEILKGDVAGMAGPGKKMAILVACTVIYRDDLAERLLDKQRSPQYTGVRIPMIKSWPFNRDIWNDYSNLRRQAQQEEIPEGAPGEFYLENREEMDNGAHVYWEDRVEPGFHSALEAAMASYFDDPRSFMAEKQNTPDEDLDSLFRPLSPIEVANRQNELAPSVVPHDTEFITCHIDVQEQVLYYVVVAWNNNFAGSILRYGTNPKQGRLYFHVRDLPKSLKSKYPGNDTDGALKAGLLDLMEQLATTEFHDINGQPYRLDRGLVDCRYKTSIVEQAIIESPFASTFIPAFGVGIGAKQMPLRLRQGLRGQHGKHWVFQKPRDRRLKSVFVDTNYWKQEAYNGLFVPSTHSCAIRLFKAPTSKHQMIADHFCSERAVRVQANGRTIDEWELPSNKPDNHYWDNLVGAMVAANTLGLNKPGELKPQGPKNAKRGKRKAGYKY